MNFRDTLVICQQCGKQYIFTVEKQRQMAEQGQEVVTPTLCDRCRQRVAYGDKLHGRIKWFDPGKGFGFLVQDSGGEIFVHRSGVSPTPDGSFPSLDEGQEVLYEITDTPKGPQAIQVTPYHG
jgi:CspA family cold shock protein